MSKNSNTKEAKLKLIKIKPINGSSENQTNGDFELTKIKSTAPSLVQKKKKKKMQEDARSKKERKKERKKKLWSSTDTLV